MGCPLRRPISSEGEKRGDHGGPFHIRARASTTPEGIAIRRLKGER